MDYNLMTAKQAKKLLTENGLDCFRVKTSRRGSIAIHIRLRDGERWSEVHEKVERLIAINFPYTHKVHHDECGYIYGINTH